MSSPIDALIVPFIESVQGLINKIEASIADLNARFDKIDAQLVNIAGYASKAANAVPEAPAVDDAPAVPEPAPAAVEETAPQVDPATNLPVSGV